MPPAHRLHRLAEKIAKSLAQGNLPTNPKEVRRQLEASPDALAELLEGLQTIIRPGSDESDPMVGAYYLLLGTQLEELRFRIERGRAEAKATVESFQDAVIGQAQSGGLPREFLFSLGALLHGAKLQPIPSLSAILSEIMAESPPPEFAANTVEELTGMLSHEFGDDPFAIVHGLQEVTHAFPPELHPALPPCLWASSEQPLREAVPLMVLDALQEVRISALKALRTATKALSGVSLRRLITLRNWLPAAERPVLDGVVKAARRQGIECAPLDPEQPARIQASLMDGSGAQGFMIVSKEGKSYRLSSVLIRQGIGLLDAWSTDSGFSKKEIDASLKQAATAGGASPISRVYLEASIRHHLAVGLDNGRVPPAGLLQVVERLGAGPWLPERLEIGETLSRLVSEIPNALKTPKKREEIIALSADWSEASGITDSWFEQDATVADYLRRSKRRRPDTQVQSLLAEVFEARRTRWTERLLWTALWCREAPEPLRQFWPNFLWVADALHAGRPLQDIPLMGLIAARSLIANG